MIQLRLGDEGWAKGGTGRPGGPIRDIVGLTTDGPASVHRSNPKHRKEDRDMKIVIRKLERIETTGIVWGD